MCTGVSACQISCNQYVRNLPEWDFCLEKVHMLGNVFVSFHRVKCSGWNSCAGARGIAPSFTVFSLSSYFVVLESKGPSNFNSHFFFFFFSLQPYFHDQICCNWRPMFHISFDNVEEQCGAKTYLSILLPFNRLSVPRYTLEASFIKIKVTRSLCLLRICIWHFLNLCYFL